jgi:hypothetical protein
VAPRPASAGPPPPRPAVARRLTIRWGAAAAVVVLVIGVGAVVHLQTGRGDPARSHAGAEAMSAAAPSPGLAAPPATTAAPLAAELLPLPPIESSPLSIAELLAGKSRDWRVARLRESGRILVIEFPDLAQQGAAANRIAALREKADAPRDRVLSDPELSALIARHGDNAQTFYAGHDYDDAAMAQFFRLAAAQRQPLNPQEERLRRLLVQAGFLGEGAQAVASSHAQALVTFTAVQADDPATPLDETVDKRRRESVLRHEYSHGRYYTSPTYREHCRRFWREALTTLQRESMRAYLARLGYDRSNEDLMVNEAQALLMHTPDTRAFDAASVGIAPKELAALRRRFLQKAPP